MGKLDIPINRIIPKNNNRYPTCFDDVISSLTLWKNRSHQFMYLDCWSFNYKSVENFESVSELFHSIIVEDYSLDNLYKYHKIYIEFIDREPGMDFYKKIEETIREGKPVFIKFDSYYNEWDPLYNKKHNNHVCIVTNVNLKQSILQITDPYFHVKDRYVPFETLDKASDFLGIVHFESAIDNFLGIQKNKIFSKYKLTMKKSNIAKINSFADQLYNIASRTDSIRPGDLPIIYSKINDIILGRLRFGITLDFYSSISYSNELHYFSKKMIEISLQWEVVLNLIAKSVLMNQLENRITIIVEKIKSISSLEESTLDEFCEFVFENIKATAKKQPSRVFDDIKYTTLDISKHFNNKGFIKKSIKNNVEINANLTGLGEFFILDQEISNCELIVNNISFIIPDFSEHLDNISCDGQKISIDNKVKKIKILGCAEWGSILALFKVNYDDDSTENIEIMFTDLSCEPMYGEEIALIGSTGEIINNEIINVQDRAFINIASLTLNGEKTVESIIIPKNKNFHILSITVGI
ncbi:hypothetical protein [Paenibacillus sp. MZ03-122A]|uniref:hypothetical protein n=1 Tax=Paenibacillus sp. MZ03-122A TaxID=2962033 RepID=UPI0020B8C14A|nr:hypothetical protein [Paenibacillus sp. MZ03-122A]MCP3781451.1 hypothetical protein [Paenibacillus sp. MZ03-122A]